MEKSKLRFAICALVMGMVCQTNGLFAQDEQKIWTMCIDSIYHQKSNKLIYPNTKYPIDPVKPVIDTTGQEVKKYPFVFYIDTKLLEIGEDLYTYRLDGLLQSKSLKLSTFDKKGKADSLEIDTTAFDFSYKLYNRDRDKTIHDSFAKKFPARYFGDPEAMAFSKVMFSKDGKSAILYSIFRNLNPFVYAFLVNKDKGRWRIVKMERKFYR